MKKKTPCSVVFPQLTYDAELAGLSFSIMPSTRGIQVSVAGWSSTAPRLLEAILEEMQRFRVKPEVFPRIREKAALVSGGSFGILYYIYLIRRSYYVRDPNRRS